MGQRSEPDFAQDGVAQGMTVAMFGLVKHVAVDVNDGSATRVGRPGLDAPGTATDNVNVSLALFSHGSCGAGSRATLIAPCVDAVRRTGRNFGHDLG